MRKQQECDGSGDVDQEGKGEFGDVGGFGSMLMTALREKGGASWEH